MNILTIYYLLFFCFRVTLLTDIDKIALEIGCLKSFIAKGVAIACFIYARCLHLGRGAKKNVELAQHFYKKVRKHKKFNINDELIFNCFCLK